MCPSKKPSIPRLELLESLLLARLVSNVEHVMKAEVCVCGYCDLLQIQRLYFIGFEVRAKSGNSLFKIGLMTSEDLYLLSIGNGSDNPADLPSRGLDIWEPANRQLWFNGPHWLADKMTAGYNEEEEDVPHECIADMKLSEQHKYQAMHILFAQTDISTVVQCEKFSSLSRLLRVAAYVLKFISILQEICRHTFFQLVIKGHYQCRRLLDQIVSDIVSPRPKN